MKRQSQRKRGEDHVRLTEIQDSLRVSVGRPRIASRPRMVPTTHRLAATSDMMPSRAEASRRKSSGRARGRPAAAVASTFVAVVGGRMSFGTGITDAFSVRS